MLLIHLLNTQRCIPDVVIHVGESDFSLESNKQQRCNVADMTAKVKKLLKSMDTHSVGCRAVFTLIWFYCHGMWAGTNNGQPTGPGLDSMEPLPSVHKTVGHMWYLILGSKLHKVKASMIFIILGLYPLWVTFFS